MPRYDDGNSTGPATDTLQADLDPDPLSLLLGRLQRRRGRSLEHAFSGRRVSAADMWRDGRTLTAAGCPCPSPRWSVLERVI